MGISQSTFHRILNSARNKLAISLIEGRRIVIMEGDTVIDSNKYSLVKSRKRVWGMSGL